MVIDVWLSYFCPVVTSISSALSLLFLSLLSLSLTKNFRSFAEIYFELISQPLLLFLEEHRFRKANYVVLGYIPVHIV